MKKTTTVVNIRTGDRGDVYVGRGAGGRVSAVPGTRGYFGNPIPLLDEAEREKVLDEYRAYFERRIETDPTFRAEVLKLRGKRLACWCHPAMCHGDVIASWLNEEEARDF